MNTNGFAGRTGVRFLKAQLDGADAKILPYGPAVLVLVDKCAGLSSGGLALTDDMSERETLGSETGCVIEIGDSAFAKRATHPKPGDRVIFERYAGTTVRGFDGHMYRVMSDSSIIAKIAFDEPTEGV